SISLRLLPDTRNAIFAAKRAARLTTIAHHVKDSDDSHCVKCSSARTNIVLRSPDDVKFHSTRPRKAPFRGSPRRETAPHIERQPQSVVSIVLLKRIQHAVNDCFFVAKRLVLFSNYRCA